MMWTNDAKSQLRRVIQGASRKIVICSPFITRMGLDFLADLIPESVEDIEIWTRLEMRDWITGASDPEALADFIDEQSTTRQVRLLTSPNLHAKLVWSDGGLGAAGSANLTYGGLAANIEILRLVLGPEIDEIAQYIEDVRPRLAETSSDHLERFLDECEIKRKDRVALVDLIREYSPPPPGPGPLFTVDAFESFCRANPSNLTAKALAISTGQDETNRSGHIHQSMLVAQRFLQEHQVFLDKLASQDLKIDFDPSSVPDFIESWIAFLNAHLDEAGEGPAYPYSFASLKRNLTGTFGGDREGGGGWNPPFRIVWPIVARMMKG